MEAATAAQLKTLLVGVPLPATRETLLEYAVQQHAEPSLLGALQTLQNGHEYDSLDDVVEELLDVQPHDADGVPRRPHEESGAPPGGDSYTERDPEPGAVRP